ncbi:Mitochondrial import inner membrane translocase subunit tim8 [Polyrhizophydium stewartii]|uniref:Mitochondrial import inner membrane translocase subunit n=1 Tax=Polyrhizophydium stewartii TaxID=2732419 RepID=A0ABR4NE17_9FUNG|nr:Mitochondrial import inner membrane translocase subunit Tim8 B [Polyrhizophydium stewartii]
MDSKLASAISGLDAKLDAKSSAELAKFIEMEEQRATFQAQVHEYTDLCWDKCITKIRPQLDNSDRVCLVNCVERFIDTTFLLMRTLGEDARK